MLCGFADERQRFEFQEKLNKYTQGNRPIADLQDCRHAQKTGK